MTLDINGGRQPLRNRLRRVGSVVGPVAPIVLIEDSSPARGKTAVAVLWCVTAVYWALVTAARAWHALRNSAGGG